MGPHYRHTQIGWVMLGGAVAAAAVAVPLLPLGQVPLPVAITLLLVVAALGVFSTLAVEVDRDELRLAFTAGLIHKRIPLADVVQFRRVKNAWWYGFGIRVIPGGGRLWNVSGYDAVELRLKNGQRFRVGTDQPVALVLAIEHALGFAPAIAGDPDAPDADADAARRRGLRLALVGAALVFVAAGAVFAIVTAQTRPPQVTVTAQAISIASLFYGESYPMDEVTSVSLERCLPRILARTNGFAGGGLLRGWFQVQGLGKGKLFVDAGSSPYVVLKTRRGVAIVNISDPQKTQALYDEIVAARGRAGSGL